MPLTPMTATTDVSPAAQSAPRPAADAGLAGQRVVVLGGSSGIGLATARALVAHGAQVIIGGRDTSRLDAAARTIPTPDGSPAEALTTTVVDAADQGAVAAFFARTGAFDHLVLTVSGAAGAGPFRTLDLDDVRRGFEAKVWPHLGAAQAALATLRPTGSITFVTAISARMASPGTAGLAAINGALEAMVRPLASELRPLRVNAVSPGVVDTPWWHALPERDRAARFAQYAAATPVGRVGRPEDVAAGILLLVTNGFITGTVLEVDGGLRFA